MRRRKLILVIFVFGILLTSCQNEDRRLIGHWHEYNSQFVDADFNHCFIITDSTIAVDRFTMGGVLKKTDFEDKYLWAITYYPEKVLNSRKVRNKEVTFGDSLVWKRQVDDLDSFIADFSAGIKLDIIPFESNNLEFEKMNPVGRDYYLYVGMAKSEYVNNTGPIKKGEFYLQLNDKITTINDLKKFIFCHHCDYDKIAIYIHADRNVPPTFLKKIESEIAYFGVDVAKQVFYLHMNKNLLKTGYKRTVTDNKYTE